MRIKLISVISLILVIASGCQSSSPTSQTTSPPMAAIPCPANNPVYVSPTFQPNLGDTCLSKNDVSNNAMTWQQAAGANARFKVSWTAFVPPTGGSSNYPYPLTGCQALATKCEPGYIAGNASLGTAYYDVTLDTGKVLNGRIIIRP